MPMTLGSIDGDEVNTMYDRMRGCFTTLQAILMGTTRSRSHFGQPTGQLQVITHPQLHPSWRLAVGMVLMLVPVFVRQEVSDASDKDEDPRIGDIMGDVKATENARCRLVNKHEG
jgi:hypothetical protein